MKLILATDIFGLTDHVGRIAQELSSVFSPVEIVDPYGGRDLDFKSEHEAYIYFKENTGLAELSRLIRIALEQSDTRPLVVGFSVGASAVWDLTDTEVSRRIARAVCFYGSRIRDTAFIEPCCETILLLPRHEDSFDVDELAETLSGRKNLTCIRTQFLHGFMNERSVHFDRQGFRTCMEWLKGLAG